MSMYNNGTAALEVTEPLEQPTPPALEDIVVDVRRPGPRWRPEFERRSSREMNSSVSSVRMFEPHGHLFAGKPFETKI